MSEGNPAADGPSTAKMGVGPVPIGPTRAMAKPGGDPLLGTVLLDRYKVLSRLGEGGMGTVYLGEHITIRKKFAIKVLSAEMALKPDVRQRFLQEAQAASMISQENVVEITDFGETPDNRAFFIMEHLAGEDLSDTVKNNGPLPWARVKPIMLQICTALTAAHAVGIIHRDMKPENVFRIKRGQNEDFCKVLDFGIAKVNSPEGDEAGKGLTKTGMIFGTPEYMSPEQAQGTKVDSRVDVYSVGIILFELLTGRVPFTGDNFMAILTKHLFEAPPAPSSVVEGLMLPPGVEEIILKAMQKDRELRFANMQEFAAAIEAIGTGAVPVAVVHENLSAPVAGGQMQFVGGAPATIPATQGTGYLLDEGAGGSGLEPVYEAPHSRAPMFAVAAVIAMAMIGTAAFMATRGEDSSDVVATVPTSTPEVSTPEVSTPITAPPSEQAVAAPVEEQVKHLAPEIPTVRLNIETNVPAKILDAADDGMYGMTNTAEGVEVEKSKERHAFILRADGYEDLRVEFVPHRNKRFTKELAKISVAVTKNKSRGSRREKEVSVYDLPTVTPEPKKPELKPNPIPEPAPEAEPPKPEPPKAEPPKPEPPKATQDATPPAPVKKKKKNTAGTKELIDPFVDG